MPCYRPIEGQQLDNGTIDFGADRGGRPLTLPCGRCIGCRIQQKQDWTLRIMHEASLYKTNSFVTLTYDDAHYEPSLNYQDFQRFMYRLRKRKGPTRFFVAGEYGDTTKRPHWHAILFGCAFSELSRIGKRLWRSPELEGLWPLGFSSTGNVTHESAAYVASYATKKITGALAAAHYTHLDYRTGELVRVNPLLSHSSLRPGIGARWLAKFFHEVYGPRDSVISKGGLASRPPRYYDKLMDKLNYDLITSKSITRYQSTITHSKNQTNLSPTLQSREIHAYAKLKSKAQSKL